jgi:hypothetical protein
MFFDEAWKHSNDGSVNFIVKEIAEVLRDHMLGIEPDPLSEHRWRLAGYRFADFLAHNSKKGVELAREFANGMRIYCEENGEIGPPVLYDAARATALEQRARKFLTLVMHASTGHHEAQAAALGFVKMFASEELTVIAAERLTALNRTLTQVQDTIAYMKKEHPMLFLWKREERAP